jgi:hypothetical protein
MHKRLKTFEKRAIDGRTTRIDAAAILVTAAVVTTIYVWWDRLLNLPLHRDPATRSASCRRSP